MSEPDATPPRDDGQAGAAEPRRAADGQVIAGYAVGVGLVFVATLGVYWNYWQPDASPWLWAGGSFAVGAVLGGAWAALRRVRL
jgi:hypothetical protein